MVPLLIKILDSLEDKNRRSPVARFNTFINFNFTTAFSHTIAMDGLET